MPESGLRGSYNLDEQTIDIVVTETSSGTYALGRTSDTKSYFKYVGRSDDDVMHD
jgi:hypothetical protein